MDCTDTLALPYILPSQAQKHVTHNEALRTLDALVQLAVQTNGLDVAPADPLGGECHIVGSAPTGAWAGQARKIAAWQDDGWLFHEPQRGWLCWSQADDRLLVFDGDEWGDAERPPLELQNLAHAGIGTTADDTNRLAVSAPATLLSHSGAGHRLKINKAAGTETATLLFQSNWTGYAECGLAGSNDFSVKVSPDGSVFREAIAIDRNTGRVALNYAATVNADLTLRNTSPSLTFTVDGATTTSWRVGAAADESFYIQRTSGGFGTGGKVIVLDSTGALGLWGLPSSAGKISLSDNINTSGVSAALHINQSATSTDSSKALLRLNNANATTLNIIECTTGTSTNVFSARANGNSIFGGPVTLKSYTVATLPGAGTYGAGSIVYVPDETGGPTVAFCDGTNWRRVQDRAVVS